MPCSDVTELLTLTVDDEDRLTEYRFVKRTCGQGVGADSLLGEQLAGRTVGEILALEPDAFLAAYPVPEGVEEFLTLKHLIAVQSALEVLTGQASGGPGEICAAAEIGYAPDATTLHVRISVDLVTERIKSCGSCGGCGKAKQERVVFF